MVKITAQHVGGLAMTEREGQRAQVDSAPSKDNEI